jgi:hypothetical protein
VSPWYWWADVPAARTATRCSQAGPVRARRPAVKYRGIFLNDEAPDLTNWVRAKFGDVPPSGQSAGPGRHRQLRPRILHAALRGDPAAAGQLSLAGDVEQRLQRGRSGNARLADEYGIVMGTSHQEPMLRAQKEWDRRYKRPSGPGTTQRTPTCWRISGARASGGTRPYESIITIGLRGANDTEMAPGGPEANRALLEKIVACSATSCARR